MGNVNAVYLVLSITKGDYRLLTSVHISGGEARRERDLSQTTVIPSVMGVIKFGGVKTGSHIVGSKSNNWANGDLKP